MSEYPLLSIITATYNNGDLLPRFFESVLNQDYQNWELIIVNDGSTDNSWDICQTYAQKDSRIRAFNQANQGQAGARNFALKQIKGSFIAFIDGDDAIKPDTYEKAFQRLLAHPECDIVAFPIEWINKKERFTTQTESSPIIGSENILEHLLNQKDIRFLLVDKIYDARLLKDLTFIPKVVFDDNLMTCQIMIRAKGICFSLLGGYEYHQEEFDESKYEWSDHKDYSQTVVNCAMCSTIDTHYPHFSLQRTRLYLRIYTYAFHKIKKRDLNHTNLLYMIPYLRNLRISDLLQSTEISIVTRLKMFAVKLWAHLKTTNRNYESR